MTDTATAAEASGTVPASPMITVLHNLAIAGDLADVEITISGKDVPVQNARALVQFVETQGISVLQGDFTALRRTTGNRGSTFQAARNFLGEPWSDAEKSAIADASSYLDAVKAYRKALPNGTRSDGAIKRMWLSRRNKNTEQKAAPSVTPSELIHDDPETGSQPVQQEIPAEEHHPDTKTPVSAKSRGTNFHSGHSWTNPDEIRLVEGAASADDAWKEYQEKYPTSTRTRNAVTSRWYLARSRERNAAPAKKENQEKSNLAKNFEASPWTDDEREPIRTATSREDAFFKYREKFPTSTRSPDAIGRQFYEMHPDKRNPEKPWTDDEKEPILTSDTMDDAIENYRKACPNSIRTDAAIRREFYELRPEKRGTVPTGRKKGGTNKTPLKGTAREKYQIPFTTTSNQREYNNAVNLCKKYDKPYAEALKIREADEAARLKKKEEKATEASKVSPGRITVLRKQAPKTPEAPPVTSKFGYRIGDDVVHNGSKSSPFFGRVGRIEKITTTDKIEHILLRFGNSSISISSEFVVPVVRKEAAAACPTS